MSVKTFRAKARDLEQVSRNYENAPACDADSELLAPEPNAEQRDVTPRLPVRLVIRPRPVRNRAA
jgi:hypothetical protein